MKQKKTLIKSKLSKSPLLLFKILLCKTILLWLTVSKHLFRKYIIACSKVLIMYFFHFNNFNTLDAKHLQQQWRAKTIFQRFHFTTRLSSLAVPMSLKIANKTTCQKLNVFVYIENCPSSFLFIFPMKYDKKYLFDHTSTTAFSIAYFVFLKLKNNKKDYQTWFHTQKARTRESFEHKNCHH